MASEIEQIQLAYTEANMEGAEILGKTKEILDKYNKYNITITGKEMVIIEKNSNRVYVIEDSNVEYKGITQRTSNNEPIIKIGRYYDSSQGKEIYETFWADNVRNNISEIETKKYIIKPDNIIEEWDVSENKDNSVIAWIVDDGNEGYRLTIAANGKIKLKSCGYLFALFSKVKKISLTNLDTSCVLNMSNMFAQCRNLNNVNLTGLDTSNVTDMSSMFSEYAKLEKIDVSNFNTENVTNFIHMFYWCTGLKNIYCNDNWYIEDKIVDSTMMFMGCRYLISDFNNDSVDISKANPQTGCFTKILKE